MNKIINFPLDDIPFNPYIHLMIIPGFECSFVYFDDKTGKYYDEPHQPERLKRVDAEKRSDSTDLHG